MGFEIWHFLAFWRTLAYFCSELCRQIFDFLTAFDSHTNDAENLTKIKFDNFEQCALEVGWWGTFGALLGFTPSGVRTPV